MSIVDKPLFFLAAAVSVSLAGCARRAPTLPPAPPQPAPPKAQREGPEAVASAAEEDEELREDETPVEITDDAITRAIIRELSHDPIVPLSRLEVSTRDGVVELTGSVFTVVAKERATRYAENIRGVASVSDQIQVDPPRKPDRALRRDVRQALRQDPVTDEMEIDVAVDDQIVRLSGAVESFPEKEFAAQVAKTVAGVKNVHNAIEVDARNDRPDHEVAADVRARLRWDTLVDERGLQVEVDDGKVILSGVVGSAAERRQACWDAWVAGGQQVDDEALTVDWRDEGLLGEYADVVEGDEAIEQALGDAMALDPRLDEQKVEVSVRNAAVVLDGTVDNLRAKMAAEQLARYTTAVTNVDNQLEVVTERPVPDRELELELEQALQRNAIVEARQVDVRTEAGTVILEGRVDSVAERAEAESLAMAIPGVQGVDNRLQVDEHRFAFAYDPFTYPYYPYVADWSVYAAPHAYQTDAIIEQIIVNEMFWSPFIDADDIEIRVEDGKATLTGVVENEVARAAAIENAYEGGAIAVHSLLRLDGPPT